MTETSKTVTLNVELTDAEAWNLAQFLKRVGFSDFRTNAQDDQEAYAMRDVAGNEQQRATHLLELSRQRVAAGLDNQLQQRQAESMVAGANLQTEAARQQIDAAGNALAALLGQGPDRALH